MKKAVRISVVVLIVLIALLFTVPYMFKGKIMDAVKTEINKTVDARVDFKDVNISLFRNFPDLSLGLGDLSVAGKGDFAQDTLVSFRSFNLDINVMSAIRGNSIQVNAITLDQPRVFARVLENGKANWDIAPEGGEEEAPQDTASGEAPALNLSLETFAINNGRIVYLDEAANMMAGLKGLNYSLSGDFSAKTSSLEQLLTIDVLNFVYDDVRYLNKAAVRFDADIMADLEKYKFTFKENTFALNAMKLNFDGWLSMPEEAMEMDIAFNTPSTNFKELLSLVPATYMKDFEELETAGSFNLNGKVQGQYAGDTLPGFKVNLGVKNGSISYPDLPEAVTNIAMQASVENPGGSGMINHVNVSRFHAEMADNPMDATLKVHTTKEDVDMSGSVKGTADLERVSQLVELDSMELKGMLEANMDFGGMLSDIEEENYESFKADGSMKLKDFSYSGPELPHPFIISESSMQFSPRELALLSFKAQTGNSDISLNGSLSNYIAYLFSDETVKGELNMTSEKLIAGNFLVESEEPEEAAETEDTTAMEAIKVPENIDFTMNARIGRLTYDIMNINDFKGKILVKNGVATLKDMNMRMLGGRLAMDGYYNSRNIQKPKINFGLDISDFSIPETYKTFNTVKKLAPIAEYMEGKLNTSLEIAGKLDQFLNPLLGSFNGKGTLKSNRIKVENATLFNAMAEKTRAQRFKNPTLQDVYASFKIVDGTVFLESKKMKLAGQEFTIAGSQGLDKSMDYTVSTLIPRSAMGGAANELINNLASSAGIQVAANENIKLNIKITGKTDDPKLGLSIAQSGESLEKQAKDKVKEELEKQKEKAKEKGKEELDSLKKKGKEKTKKKADSLKKKAKEKAKEKLEELW